MATFISNSAVETLGLGEAWGRAAREGLVIGLSGDLGAGKTQFVKGLAQGLKSPARVHSPTFTLVNVYAGGRLPLFHLDLYRLETPQQILAAGLEEYLHPEGITVIEWAERWFGAAAKPKALEGASLEAGARAAMPPLPSRFVPLEIEILDNSTRRITYEDPGP